MSKLCLAIDSNTSNFAEGKDIVLPDLFIQLQLPRGYVASSLHISPNHGLAWLISACRHLAIFTHATEQRRLHAVCRSMQHPSVSLARILLKINRTPFAAV